MLRVINWSSFQSYKDRNPPWIRLHKRILDDYNFHRLSESAQALLFLLWLLAAEDEDPVSGLIRIGYEEISFRLRKDQKAVKVSIDEIVRAGFIERVEVDEMPLFNEKTDSYKSVTDVLQKCHPEAEAEAKTKTEAESPNGGSFDSSFKGKKLKGLFSIKDAVTEDGIEEARRTSPGWDIFRLMDVYDKGIEEGRRQVPKNPDISFIAFCKAYTKGKPP